MKAIIFWSNERSEKDRLESNRPADGEWVVAKALDHEYWFDTFSTKEEAEEYCRKNGWKKLNA